MTEDGQTQTGSELKNKEDILYTLYFLHFYLM